MQASSQKLPPIRQAQRVAVLGGLGFIGSHICRALVDAGHPVVAIDREDAPRDRLKDVAQKVDIRPADMSQTADVLAVLEGADTLIHLVHSTVPGASMSDPSADIVENVAATARLAGQLGSVGIKRVLYVSSGGAVYGVNDSPRISEKEPTNPISSYGITKLANEKYLQMFAAMQGLRCTIIRPANVYGPQQRLDKGQGIIGTLISRALRGEPVEIWGEGTVVRDYVYIDDMVAAILALVGYEGRETIFNVGTGQGYSVSDILCMMERDGILPEIVYKPARGFDVPSNVLDCGLLTRETGWQIRTPLEEGLLRVISSFSAKA